MENAKGEKCINKEKAEYFKQTEDIQRLSSYHFYDIPGKGNKIVPVIIPGNCSKGLGLVIENFFFFFLHQDDLPFIATDHLNAKMFAKQKSSDIKAATVQHFESFAIMERLTTA